MLNHPIPLLGLGLLLLCPFAIGNTPEGPGTRLSCSSQLSTAAPNWDEPVAATGLQPSAEANLASLIRLEAEIAALEIRPLAPNHPHWDKFDLLLHAYVDHRYWLALNPEFLKDSLLRDATQQSNSRIQQSLASFRRVFLSDSKLMRTFLKAEAGMGTQRNDYRFGVADWLMMGLDPVELGGKVLKSEAVLAGNGHQVGYGPSNLHALEAVLNELKLSASHTVLDVGSGYGRVVLYGASTQPAKFIGIEVVGERAASSERARQELQLTNAQIVHGNLLDPKHRTLLENTDVFYLFNPLSLRDLNALETELSKLSEHKYFRVVTFHMPLGFHSALWLRQIKYDRENRYWIFETCNRSAPGQVF